VARFSLTFSSALWIHDGPAAWYFVSLPVDDADAIADHVADRTNAFGSVRVEATIGDTSWRTSLFPDTRSGTYLLPVKKAVRSAEGLSDGTPVSVRLSVLEDEN
jgi:hypothetical protein